MFQDARRVIDSFIADAKIPGAVWIVAQGGQVLAHEAQGYADPDAQVPMRLDTLFDMASLTKVTATLPAVLRLLEQGYFRLEDPLQLFLPEYPTPEVTIRHLLTHTAGYQPSEKLWGNGWSRDQALDYIHHLSPQNPVGEKVVYSDTSFILLGMLVERLTGLRLDQAVQQLVFDPLGMKRATFHPGPETAPTEFREALGHHQQGEVHDENATALEGVAGHAGLFATSYDLLAYATMWMGWPGPRLLSMAMRTAARREWANQGERRGLGWLLKGERYSPSGDLMSFETFGHTGFTGTSLWMDPARDLAVILLTNRVYYGRQDAILRLRPRFHNSVVAALG